MRRLGVAVMAGLAGVFLVAGGAAAKTKLTVWLTDWNGQTRPWWAQTLYPAWQEANPDVDIDVVWQSWDRFTNQLMAAQAAGEPPDVFQPGAEFVWEMASGGFARPIDEWWAAWPQRDDYFPLTLQTERFGGHLYGVPVLSAPRTYLVRTDALVRHGYPATARPQSWDDFLHMAVRLTDGDATTVTALGTDLVWNFLKYLAFLWQNGGDLFSPDHRQVWLDRPEAVQALQFLVDLNQAVVQNRTVRGGLGFRNGTVALQYNSQFGLKNLVISRPQDLPNVAVAAPLREKTQKTPVFTDWLAILSGSAHPDLAWKFITFFSEPKRLAQYNDTLFFIPPTRAAVEASEVLRQTPKLMAFADVMVQYGRPVPPSPIRRWATCSTAPSPTPFKKS